MKKRASPRPTWLSCRRGNRFVHPESILLHEFLGPSAHYWLGLQADYDLQSARARYWASERSHGEWDEPRDEWAVPFED